MAYDVCLVSITVNLIYNCLISESTLLSDVAYVMCLDSIGAEDNLFLHVSKPPREGTIPHEILTVRTIDCVYFVIEVRG